MFDRWKLVIALMIGLALVAPCVAVQRKAKGKEKVIAKLGVVIGTAQAYPYKSSDAEPVAEFASGTKVVVLSYSTEWVRILMADDSEPFIPASNVVLSEDITLKGAFARVRYFDRMKEQYPWEEETYDVQAAPWVRLVVLELAKQPGARLPDPEEILAPEELSNPELTVTNDTGAVLTVYIAGPTARSVTIPRGSKKTWTLPAGSYKASATVDKPNVTPLSSTWVLKLGYVHTVSLYIKTYRVP